MFELMKRCYSLKCPYRLTSQGKTTVTANTTRLSLPTSKNPKISTTPFWVCIFRSDEGATKERTKAPFFMTSEGVYLRDEIALGRFRGK